MATVAEMTTLHRLITYELYLLGIAGVFVAVFGAA